MSEREDTVSRTGSNVEASTEDVRQDDENRDEVDASADSLKEEKNEDKQEPVENGKASPTVSVTYSDDGVDTLITDHYPSLMDQLEQITNQLNDSHLKQYSGLSKLKEVTNHVSAHMKYNEEYIAHMVSALHQTNSSLNKLNSTIIRKLQEEQLESWLDRPITAQDVSEQSGSRELMAKAAELRENLAKTELQMATVTKLCADMELATVEAQQMSVQARQAAEEAARRAEEAEKAAKEKAKAEEEKRKKAEALQKKQAEEERLRKEMEEKRRIEMEQAKGTPEEQERINPNNWPSYTYKSQEANEFDGSYQCVIRAMPGIMGQDDVVVKRVGQLESGITLDNNVELVGNIISVQPAISDDGYAALNAADMSLEEPLSILLPHCAPRNTAREVAVMWRQFQDSNWVCLDAKECNIEAVKETKLVECRPKGLGMFAAVFRLKTDHHTITKKGGKFSSSVDSRLCVQCRPGAFRVNTSFTLQLQPVDLASVSDVKVRFPEDCGDLISSSPIVCLAFPTPTLKRPINIITPIPANATRPKRPVTAVDKDRSKTPSRPTSAFGLGSYQQEEDGEDILHLLALTNEGHWCVTEQMEFVPQNKKGDLISVNTNIIPNKFWLLRTKAKVTTSQVEILADRLYDYLHRRLAQFVMRQKAGDPTDITLVCVPSQKLDRTIRRLDDEGYADGTKMSSEIFVKEGQKLEIRFRGNLQPDEDVDLITCFNSQLRTQINMYITEIDKYAQKSFNSYRGFAQFFTEGMVTKDIYDESDKKKGDQRKPIGTEEVWDNILLTELLINLPKPEPEAPKPLRKAKLNLFPEGPIDDSLLRQLSTDLGDEWKMLAAHLNVKKTRIQSIMRNHVNSDAEAPIYEMLLTWIKRIPRSMDKVKMLCEALRVVGRLDLVEDVRDKEYDYKELRAEHIKENLLRQMSVKIAQHHAGLSKWRDIAHYLHVPEEDLLNIENEYSTGRERCIRALEAWQRNQGASATPQQLVRAVKHFRLNDLTGEIRRMISQ